MAYSNTTQNRVEFSPEVLTSYEEKLKALNSDVDTKNEEIGGKPIKWIGGGVGAAIAGGAALKFKNPEKAAAAAAAKLEAFSALEKNKPIIDKLDELERAVISETDDAAKRTAQELVNHFSTDSKNNLVVNKYKSLGKEAKELAVAAEEAKIIKSTGKIGSWFEKAGNVTSKAPGVVKWIGAGTLVYAGYAVGSTMDGSKNDHKIKELNDESNALVKKARQERRSIPSSNNQDWIDALTYAEKQANEYDKPVFQAVRKAAQSGNETDFYTQLVKNDSLAPKEFVTEPGITEYSHIKKYHSAKLELFKTEMEKDIRGNIMKQWETNGKPGLRRDRDVNTQEAKQHAAQGIEYAANTSNTLKEHGTVVNPDVNPTITPSEKNDRTA